MIVQFSSSTLVVRGLRQFQRAHAGFFTTIDLFYVEEVEAGQVPPARVGAALDAARVVLFDVRSNRTTARLLRDHLANREDVIVVSLLGTSMDLLALNRLSDFDLASMGARFAGSKEAEADARPDDGAVVETFHEPEVKPKLRMRVVYFLRKLFKVLGRVFFFSKKMRRLREIFLYTELWETGKVENFLVILERLAARHLGLEIPRRQRHRRQKMPPAGFWRPEVTQFKARSLTKHLKRHPLAPGKPSVLVIFYGGMHYESSLAAVEYLHEKYADAWNLVYFFTDGVFTTKYLEEFFPPAAVPFDAVLSLVWFPLNGGPGGGDLTRTHALLQRWGKPVFNGVGLYNQDWESFRDRPEGLSPIQTLAAVIFPEMDGMTDPVPVLCHSTSTVQFGEKTFRVYEPQAIEENLDLLVTRIARRVRLQDLPAADKKVALVLYNYPPGEARVGSAAYFDGLASLCTLLGEFEARGYSVTLPAGLDARSPAAWKRWILARGFQNYSRWDALRDRLPEGVRAGNGDAARPPGTPALRAVSLPGYLAWYRTLDPGLRAAVEAAWGPPPGEIHVVDDTLYLPVVALGNLFVGLQPSRGDVEDLEKAYHDMALPPHHEYLCFYYFLHHHLRVDAVVHLGTHGTLEFLPGKEVGMTPASDYNYTMVAGTPHFYLYQVSNTSEGMIAKRRSLATLLTYQLPPFTNAGLDRELAGLEARLHALQEAERLGNPATTAEVQALLAEARERGIHARDVESLNDEIVQCKTALIPRGLHVFGHGFDVEAAAAYLWSVQPMIPVRPNLFEHLARAFNLPATTAEDLAAWCRADPADPARQRVEATGVAIIRGLLDGNGDGNVGAARQAGSAALANLPARAGTTPVPSLAFVDTEDFASLADRLRAVGRAAMYNRELELLFAALEGRFVPPNVGGDPVRTPAVLPSGTNMYQFNPQLIPTDLAVKRGRIAAEQTLALYREEHEGVYPRSVAFVLWGFETAKTHGEAIGQILALLGVRIKPLEMWRREVELIPLAELGRPRVNVTINICGFMRDLFSHCLDLVDAAIDLAIDDPAPPDAGENFVKGAYESLRARQVDRGAAPAEAEFLARARVFGPAAAEYGSNLPTLVESGAWKEASELGEAYLRQMQYVYRGTARARPALALFKDQLRAVDAISQVRDSAAYAVTDLDHYYEFVGGLNQAAKAAGKESTTPVYFSDTSRVRVETTGLRTAVNRGVVTRTANPKWIKAMLAHDYSGGKKVADRVNFLLGFAATAEQVDDTAWDQVYRSLVENEEIRGLMRENNVHAFRDAVETLLEAVQRELWAATDAQVDYLKELYLELEGLIEQ